MWKGLKILFKKHMIEFRQQGHKTRKGKDRIVQP